MYSGTKMIIPEAIMIKTVHKVTGLERRIIIPQSHNQMSPIIPSLIQDEPFIFFDALIFILLQRYVFYF